MRKTLLAAFVVSSLLLGGCKKDKNNNDETSASNGTVTAERYGVDGGATNKFTSSKAGITQTTVNGVSTFTLTAIKDGSNECITAVILHKITGPETIDLIYNNREGSGIIFSKDYTKPADAALNYKTTNTSSTMKGGGELKITKLSGDKVEGTFYFVAINSAGKEAWAENGTFSGVIK